MLEYLKVANLGVLTDAVIEPGPGLTVITGETGAGKTLLLGGLRLLLGEKADASAVGPAADQAQADGLFSATDEIGVTRVVPKTGNSRARIDGALVSAGALGESVGRLVEIVGQHDQLRLRKASEVLGLVDDALDAGGRKARDAYTEAWTRLQDALDRQEALGGDEMALRRELDLVRFQSNEIEQADLDPGEDETLETTARRLRNVEETREHLAESVRLLDLIIESGGELVSRTRKAAELDPTTKGLTDDAESALAHISELRADMRAGTELLESDPGRLDEIEARLTTIGELKRKYGRTVSDVVAFGKEASSRTDELSDLLEGAADLEREIASALSAVESTAERLSEARSKAAESLATSAATHLDDLALGRARLAFGFEPTDHGPTGADKAAILFASDTELPMTPIGAGASGGELSRLVLAIRLAVRSPETVTLVFDEIDTGIGGRTALAMGRKLAELATTTQVLCVSHLPQVAAHADAHYVVERHGASASTHRVDGEERVREISRMLAGLPNSEAGRLAASELLAEAKQ